MRSQDEILEQLVQWARNRESVRAVVLTSSRANPERETDILSDYDVECYVTDIELFERSDGWLSHFGEIMVRWPLIPRSAVPWADITRLVLFEDAVRIDFQIRKIAGIPADAYDDDYRVLLDKDGLLAHLKPPTHTKHLVNKPTREQYETLASEFWWNAHYVPKSLKRDELPFAAGMLCRSIRGKYLHTAIGWLIGLENDWSVNPGVSGRKFKHYLDDATWGAYEATFAGPEIEAQWAAFFSSVELFRRLMRRVADDLGYAYPEALDKKMTAYFRWMQSVDITSVEELRDGDPKRRA